MQVQLATVTQKGQVLLTKNFRDHIGIRPYSKVLVEKGKDHLKIKPAGPSIFELAGKFRIPKSMPGILKAREVMEKNYSRF